MKLDNFGVWSKYFYDMNKQINYGSCCKLEVYKLSIEFCFDISVSEWNLLVVQFFVSDLL